MNTQQYHAGETAEATLEFLYGERVKKVTATFAHVEDPDTRIQLSGEPAQEVASNEAGYTYWHVVLSESITVENKLGTYRCEAVEAEYPGGRKVPFGSVPGEIGLQIVEEDIPPPEVLGTWRWGAGS